MLHLCNQDNPANRGSGWIEFLNGGLGFVTSLSDWSTSTLRPTHCALQWRVGCLSRVLTHLGQLKLSIKIILKCF